MGNLHACDLTTHDFRGYGSLVDYCFEQESGELWIKTGNGEYESQVNYCPKCGYKAKVEAKEI